MSDAKLVSVVGKIVYNTGDVGTVTGLKLSPNGHWIQEPPKEIHKDEPATFVAAGIALEGEDVKGSIEIQGITLTFCLDGDKNDAGYKQAFGPTITATITPGVRARANYDIER